MLLMISYSTTSEFCVPRLAVCLLRLSRQGASIILSRPDKTSIVVLSFKNTVDIINASLSPDSKLVHVTDRFRSSTTTQLCYRSSIYAVQAIAKTNDRFYSEPIDAFFVAKPSHYHLVVHSPGLLTNFQVIRDRKQIQRKKPEQMSNIVWVATHVHFLWVASEYRKTFEFHLFEENKNYG